MDLVCKMLYVRILKRKLFILLVIALAFWTAGVSFGQELGELRLEGKHIERLVLRRKDGHTEQFIRPAKTIQLPVGVYRLQQVSLDESNFSGLLMEISSVDWITISEDKPAILKVGAPLNQIIEVTRQGSILVLDYKLLGVGGEVYVDSSRRVRPRFTIYEKDKKIATSEFEFG